MPPSPPIPSPPLAADLLCIHCQYNLRTRSPQDRCPECGAPVAQSLAHYRAYAGAIREPAALRLAAWCFAVPSLLAIVAYLLLALLRLATRSSPSGTILDLFFQYVLHVVFIAALLLGVILLGASVSRLIAPPAIRVLLALLAIAYGCANVVLSLAAVSLLLFGRRQPFAAFVVERLVREQRLGTALICLIMALAGYSLMLRLAHALASPRLRAFTHLAFTLLIADAALSLVFFILAGTWRLQPGSTEFASLYAARDLASALLFLAFGAYWLLVARMVREKTQPPPVESPFPASPAPAPSAQKRAHFFAHRRP